MLGVGRWRARFLLVFLPCLVCECFVVSCGCCQCSWGVLGGAIPVSEAGGVQVRPDPAVPVEAAFRAVGDRGGRANPLLCLQDEQGFGCFPEGRAFRCWVNNERRLSERRLSAGFPARRAPHPGRRLRCYLGCPDLAGQLNIRSNRLLHRLVEEVFASPPEVPRAFAEDLLYLTYGVMWVFAALVVSPAVGQLETLRLGVKKQPIVSA